jgi:hypothetical protein
MFLHIVVRRVFNMLPHVPRTLPWHCVPHVARHDADIDLKRRRNVCAANFRNKID